MPSPKKSIFDLTKDLKPTQIRTVAQRRYADAQFLFNVGANGQLNAAMYLGGFVIECLLKARLLEKSAGNVRFGIEDKQTDRIVRLVFQSHDLQKMLAELPEIEQQLQKQDQQRGTDLLRQLRAICTVWTIYARYSTQLANRNEAKRFLDNIREIKRCL